MNGCWLIEKWGCLTNDLKILGSHSIADEVSFALRTQNVPFKPFKSTSFILFQKKFDGMLGINSFNCLQANRKRNASDRTSFIVRSQLYKNNIYMDRQDEGSVRIISDPSRVHNLQPAVEENLDRDELINTLDLVFRKINS